MWLGIIKTNLGNVEQKEWEKNEHKMFYVKASTKEDLIYRINRIDFYDENDDNNDWLIMEVSND